ncbi:MAG: hypothetical protein EOO61_10440, partial [Hymenobacter sp.]
MVTITANADIALDMYETGIGSSLSQNISEIQSNRIDLVRGSNYFEILEGAGFGINNENSVTGIVSKITETVNNVKSFVIEGMSTSADSILTWGENRDYQAFFDHILTGSDAITGSNLDDRVFSSSGNDVIKTGLGDDDIDAGSGYNVIDGGGGYDNLHLAGNVKDYNIIRSGETYILTSNIDNVKTNGVELFSFDNGDEITIAELQSKIQPFSGLNYAASYDDIRKAFGADSGAAESHFEKFGFNEGRNPNKFEPLSYIAAYSDLRTAFGVKADDATRHYINFGVNEGRDIRFDGMAYLASNSDIRAAFG